MFCKKAVLANFTKFARKETGTIVFFCEFWEFFRFFERLYLENSYERLHLYFKYGFMISLNNYIIQEQSFEGVLRKDSFGKSYQVWQCLTFNKKGKKRIEEELTKLKVELSLDRDMTRVDLMVADIVEIMKCTKI